jgi:predicted Zn-dependent peptidase
MVLSVTGDVNVKDTLGLIKERFGDIRSEASKPFPEWKAPVLEKAEEVTLRMPKKEALFLIGFTGVDINDRTVMCLMFCSK